MGVAAQDKVGVRTCSRCGLVAADFVHVCQPTAVLLVQTAQVQLEELRSTIEALVQQLNEADGIT